MISFRLNGQPQQVDVVARAAVEGEVGQDFADD